MIIPCPTSHLAAQQTMYLPRETRALAVIISPNVQLQGSKDSIHLSKLTDASKRGHLVFKRRHCALINIVARCKVAKPLLVDVRALR